MTRDLATRLVINNMRFIYELINEIKATSTTYSNELISSLRTFPTTAYYFTNIDVQFRRAVRAHARNFLEMRK